MSNMDFMKVRKGALIVMREMRNASNIYKVLGNTIVGYVVSSEFDNDAAKL